MCVVLPPAYLLFNYPMETFRYKAFISYSHRDKDWGAWLQRSLERYRVPRRLVGTQGEFGAIPRRLTPVFRDREDLSSSSDLSAKVKECLANSEAMVVICSPASAQSLWVNEEVRYFQTLGREDRIFALIVDGDPQSEAPDGQCFPVTLTSDPDGNSREPLAADARKWADGKLLAKLKIISGILGIPLDALRRRDMQRRQRIWMVSAGCAMVIAIVMAALAVIAVTARTAAENRREHAEELVGYMVGDLKTKLDEVGRLDILEGMGGRVSEYLETLNPEELTDESLNQQAQVWRQLGEVGMEQGDLAGALSAFSTSRDILAELHRRNPERTDFVFELGNAEFWVGYVHLESGDFEKAEAAMNTYLEYANQLVEMEPGNAKWLMEKSYAHGNLAALIVKSGGSDTESALFHNKAAVDLNKKVLELDPDNTEYQSQLGIALAWLADTQLMACDLGNALISRQESVAIAQKQAEEFPGNSNYRSTYAYAMTGVANVAFQVGLAELALENYTRAKEILGQLSLLDPSDLNTRFTYLKRETYAAIVLSESGQLNEALARMEMVREPLTRVLETESYGNLKRYIDWVSYLLAHSDMNWRAGNRDVATALMSEAVDHLSRLVARENGSAPFAEELLIARFLYWQQRGVDLLDSPDFDGMESRFDKKDASCQLQANLVREAILKQEFEIAGELTSGLLSRGYYDPGFIRTCRQYDLCE